MGIVIRESIKATIVNCIGAILGFVTSVFVMTQFLKPEEIGLTKVIYEIAALVAGFAQLGTSASAMRFFPYFKDHKKNHNGFFFYLMLMPTVGSVVFISLFLLLQGVIVDFFSEKSALLVSYYSWIIPLIIFLTFWTILETYANVLLKIVVPKFIKEIGVRVLLLGIYGLYAMGWLDLSQLIIAYVSVYGIAMFATFFYVSRITSVSFAHNFAFIDRALINKITKYTLFVIVGAIGGNIIGQLDLFMVSSQMGLGYAGIYTITSYMAFVIELPARSITSISTPLVASILKDGDLGAANQLYKKVSLHQLMAGSILFLLIWININNIFAIIPNGELYQTGKWVVFFIAMSKIVAMTLSFGGTLISFSRYYYWGLYFTFFLTILTITTNYFFIPLWGMTGAAVATLFTCLVSYSFQQWIVLKKIKGNPYSWSTLKQIIIVAMLLVANLFLPCWCSNSYVDIIYRSTVIGGCWLVLAYKFKVSEEFCHLIRGLLKW